MEKKPNSPNNPEPFGNWFKPFQQLLSEAPVKSFLNTIDDFFRQPMFPQATFPISVKDLGNKHLVTAELPGIKKEQIGINIIENRLSISVKQLDIVTEENDKNNTYLRRESMQHSSRTITFPHPLDEERVKASYRNGLLEITIPKVKGKTIDIIE